jgi:hypothetical protein
MNYGYDDLLSRVISPDERAEIERMILTPRDVIAVAQLGQAREMAERLGSPAEAALGAIRRATCAADGLRLEVQYWKNKEEEARFEACDLRDGLRNKLAASFVLGGVLVFLAMRLWR